MKKMWWQEMKGQRLVVLTLVVMLAGVLAGCGGSSDQAGTLTTELPSSGSDMSKLATTEVRSPSEVVVVIDDQPITQAELDRATDMLIEQMTGGQQVPPEQLMGLRQKAAEQATKSLAMKITIMKYAKENNLVVPATEIDMEIDRIKANFGTPEELNARLKAMGISPDNLRQEITDVKMMRTAIDFKRASLPDPASDEMQKFYEKNSQMFHHGNEVQASHILIATSPQDTSAQLEVKMASAEAILKRLQAGEDFATLAQAYSDCPSKEKGGDLGRFGKGQMVKEFEEVAFTIDPGSVSSVVPTQFGFHIIKVANRVAEGTDTIEDASERIKSDLKDEMLTKWLSEMRDKAKVEKK